MAALQWFDLIGLVGVLLIIFNHLRLVHLEKTDTFYFLAGLASNILVVVSLMFAMNVSALFMQVFFIATCFWGLWKIRRSGPPTIL